MLSIAEPNVSRLTVASRLSTHSQAKGQCSMKILVVDDQFLSRDALCAVLKQLKSGATVLEAVDGRGTMQLVSAHGDIDLILLELNLPDRDGLSVLRELRERHPAISVAVLSGRRDRASVVKALDLGALGFISKSGQWGVMLSALNLVLAGGVYIPPEILSREDEECSHPNPGRACPAPDRRPVRHTDLGLTERQIDVLKLMMTGQSNKAISRTLNLALPTVKNHITAILKAIKVTNRTEAVIAIGGLGLEWPLAQPCHSENERTTA